MYNGRSQWNTILVLLGIFLPKGIEMPVTSNLMRIL
jgi:hypothetical protein